MINHKPIRFSHIMRIKIKCNWCRVLFLYCDYDDSIYRLWIRSFHSFSVYPIFEITFISTPFSFSFFFFKVEGFIASSIPHTFHPKTINAFGAKQQMTLTFTREGRKINISKLMLLWPTKTRETRKNKNKM